MWEENLSKSGPFKLKDLADLVEEGRDFAVSNGLIMVAKNSENPNTVHHIPFTLLPSPFPKYLFEEAIDVQKDFNILTHKVGQDFQFLKSSLESVMKVDEFTRNIFQIYETVTKEGLSQPLSLGLLRSDYMVDGSGSGCSTNGDHCSQREYEIKQIELNTISVGAAGGATIMSHLHRYVCNLYKDGRQNATREKIPENAAVKGLAHGLVQAWELYGVKDAVIMFVVVTGDRNRFGQRWVEFYIREQNPSVTVIRKTLAEIADNGKMDDQGILTIDGQEVAVTYFRAGYSPDHYPTDKQWQARLLVERSKSIKCPTAALQLVGTKKIQQILALPGQLERFIADEESIKRLRRTFAGLYTMDLNEEGDKSVAMVMQNPAHFVLKPQREGGGNNFFGESIKELLDQLPDPEKRTQYILMERISPPVTKNYIVRAEEQHVELTDVSSELGVYGIFIGGPGDVVHLNEAAGHLLRTKSTIYDEGGSLAERSGLDSPLLI